jgi:hypothetical protein
MTVCSVAVPSAAAERLKGHTSQLQDVLVECMLGLAHRGVTRGPRPARKKGRWQKQGHPASRPRYESRHAYQAVHKVHHLRAQQLLLRQVLYIRSGCMSTASPYFSYNPDVAVYDSVG